MALGQFYHVAVDNQKPYHVYGGLQDNGSWGGPSRTLRGTGPINEDWIVRRRRRRLRLPRRSERPGHRLRREPGRRASAAATCAPASRRGIRPQPAEGTARRYRFNWNTPFILSNHNPQHLLLRRQLRLPLGEARATTCKPISPEITRTKRGTMPPRWPRSPANPDVLWAGTDDGVLWVTRDGGAEVDERDREPEERRAARPALGGEHRAVARRRGPLLRRLRRPPLRRRQAVRLRHRGLRPDVEVAREQPAGVRLDARAARGHRRTRTCSTCGTEFGIWASINRGGDLDEDQQQPADGGGPRVRAADRRPARSWSRRTAAACGCWT